MPAPAVIKLNVSNRMQGVTVFFDAKFYRKAPHYVYCMTDNVL